MHPTKAFLVGGILAVATILAACSSSSTAAGSPTITTASVGSNGTLIVDGSTSMTLYTFSKDTANSGTSACTSAGGCITTWPALTVPAGTTPTAGAGATGTIGTISRTDSNGALQVTYNGLPLYYFSGDKAVGDSKGIYKNWNAVKP